MKPGRGDSNEEVAEVHRAARSPSPTEHAGKPQQRPRGDSASRKLSNGHADDHQHNDSPSVSEDKMQIAPKAGWVNSEQNASLEEELPIHDQIKQGILGFVENEIKKSDSTKPPTYVFYSHDPSGSSEDRLTLKSLSRPSSGHREKRSPSYRKKRKHISRRERDLHEFEIPGSSLSALERVDDYLKEYNKDEVVTLSGDLEIEANDVENNNGNVKDTRYRQRKARRKTREERQDKNANSSDVSPKVHTAMKHKQGNNKPARPMDLSTMFEPVEPVTPYQEQYIDNPFSSPSPVMSPSDSRVAGFNRPDRVYLQGGGTFRAVSRDTLGTGQRATEEQKYLRLGDLTPLDIALTVQKAWRNLAPACHGLLGGLSLMHLLLITCTDGLDAGHLSFHAVVTMPYVTTYYFLCVLCLLSVLDRLDATSLDLSRGLQPYFQPIVLVILYMACLMVCTAARLYDEKMLLQYTRFTENATFFNVTTPAIPTFYHTWTHLSIWRAVLSILGLAYLVITNPPDLVYTNLSKLLQFKQSLQSIG